jgi:hypothetical protein
MALIYTQADAGVLENYRESVRDFWNSDVPVTRTIHVPVDKLGLRELAQGATLDAATPSGCRLYSITNDGDVISAEMTDAALYGKSEVRSVKHGGRLKASLARIESAEKLQQVADLDYELRLLSIPSLLLEALRLRSTVKGRDLVLPLNAADDELTAKAVFEAAEFLAIARRLAAERLAAEADGEDAHLSS